MLWHFTGGGMQKGLKKYFVNMDEYLSSLGLYRKMVARDASSLFRAVSEQLYYSQNYHQKIRQDCANFMRANRCNFEPFVEGSFEKYLERLEDPKETVGQVEIKALSQLYRRCFLIYRYPGKPATLISEEDFVDKVTLCCSINGHYDIVYPRSYPATAALCQSLLYELLYTHVFGYEEAELCQAMEAFRVGSRRYRNSPSVCSDVDIGYDTPEDRGQRDEVESCGAAEEKPRGVNDDLKPAADTHPPSRLCLPYKVMKSLDGEVYRNLEFDVWQDTCKEMQKTDYMVFAGRQYFLGDKCQVRLEPKGKYYNAFIQEVGTHSAAVTVFIEELGEKHLVPLTDLKPVNPVPAWNVAAPSRKGELDSDSRGQRHPRHRYFRKSRGSSGVKGAELLMAPTSSYGSPAPSSLPPRFQPAGHPRPPPPPSPGAMAYDPYTPPHHHPSAARPPRYGTSRSSTRFLNRHLIGPQLTYYHPGRRYYHDYENYAFRSRRSRRQLAAALNKECQFSFTEAVEEPPDLDTAIAYYQLDDGNDTVFPPLAGPAVAPPPNMGAPPPPPGPTYRVRRASGPIPSAPPPGNTPVCSSEEDQEDTSTMEDQTEYTEEYIYSPQVALAIPTTSPWLVNELGETLCTLVAPPPYSYDPNGNDLPRDCRVLQYYFNLGVQWYHQSCWQQQQAYPPTSPEAPYTYQHYSPYLSTEHPLHGPSTEGSSTIGLTPTAAPPSSLLYQDQGPLPPPALLHLPYEAPPPTAYLASVPPPPLPHAPHPHPAHLSHHSTYHCLPASTHWGALQTGAPRMYCPTPNPTHVVGYITAPPPHHAATHYMPPTI
ncbi:putative bifunctional UDP-N-acetylglucosamine transferase and deubiquitinase ALG13 [Channa argus]|uniref:ubiquitinyl hydrolase 1 n=1 Tax=Channa argus TaxID=215402 RepID=A0A6G1PDM0_CHAAH|nr:putative bifunctional UDP-N-acetylglucosamine transferase and deubiquitinase ALG13 [Channa argus]